MARIIPAGAGLTWRGQRLLQSPRDHPRGCGAHLEWRVIVMKRVGSSPRVRGSLDEMPDGEEKRGIIPAGAGLTGPVRAQCTMQWDHPRGCGAHVITCSFSQRMLGSSPRVRGSLNRCLDIFRHPGIIPAGAGLTVCEAVEEGHAWDHPRGCGAHPPFSVQAPLVEGSSPRVRGSLTCSCVGVDTPGIIPAGAGLTSPMSR